MLVLVRSGLGMALVPESAQTMHPEGVVFRPVSAVRDRPVQMNAAWRSDNRNPALRRFMEDVLPQREWE
jgi:DNA-binding transcriptional LysR family regulator